MTTDGWTPTQLPDLSGVVAVVTGANSGLGFEATLELARHGAHVVLAARDPERGDEALGQVRVRVPGCSVELRRLDLADLADVRSFAAGLASERVDLLLNNAGVMAPPRRTVTTDGFELQFGTNHLGHFALTGLLLPALLRGRLVGGPARVVTVSSSLHHRGRLHRDDLMAAGWYTGFGAYGQSKLANLLFCYELQRRATAAGVGLMSLAAHPGYAATNLQARGQRDAQGEPRRGRLVGLADRLLAQPAAQGAWPLLRAAADPQASGGQYYGPTRFGGQRGHPAPVPSSARANDLDDAGWLWERSVRLTGVDYPELARRSTSGTPTQG